MNRYSLIFCLLVLFSNHAKAQSGLRQLQISGQASRPMSSLLTVTNYGYGGSFKGLYGFGDTDQQATLEVGYNRFPLKHLSAGVEIYYSALPVYAGYRYIYKKFSFEPQLGLSVNRIYGRNSMISESETFYNLGWAVGAGYILKNFEIGLRCQISEIHDRDDDLNFLGLRLAYNINL
jgi:hypothetical protein